MAVTALLSAELTAGWVLSQEPVYEGKVTVFLSQLFPRGTPGYDIEPFVGTFELTMKSPERIAEIARATQATEADIRAKLGSARAPQSPIVDVTYGPGEEAVVTDVARQAAVLSMQGMARGEVEQAQVRLTQARTAADAGRRALSEFETQNGLLDLDQAYEDQRALLLEQLAGDTPAATVASSQQELDRLAGLRLQRDELARRLEGAVANIAAAEDERLAAESRLTAAGSPSLILPSTPTQTSRLPLLARGVIGSALVSVAAWFLVFLLVDRRSAARSSRADRDRIDFDDRQDGRLLPVDGERQPYVDDRVGAPVGSSRFATSPFSDRPVT